MNSVDRGDDKPAVAVVTHDCVNGGSVGNVAWQQILQLAQSFTVHVIAMQVPAPLPENVVAHLVRPRRWTLLRRLAHVPNDLSFQRAARLSLATLASQISLRAVWCHSHATVVHAAGKVAKLQNCPIILTTHGDIFDRPPGTYDRLLTIYYKWCTERAYARCSTIQALSPYMQDVVRARTVRADKVVLIPNGVNPAEIGLPGVLHRAPDAISSGDTLSLLFVGNLQPIKGVRHLLRALATIESGKPVRLICIGDGPEASELKVLSKQLGVSGLVSFLGKVARPELGEYYRAADLLCIPSDNDPLPTVVLEGFCAGLPAVGSRTGGIEAMLGGGRGVLFTPGDAEELGKVLAALAADKGQLAEMSQACSRAAETEYAWPTVGARLRELVDSLKPPAQETP